ncbi:polysaccharide biosynthesis protein [Sutcliffiella horikoshii]|uniref:putative polysaccharide biosynthesis protein n=1 Tax=Sutcliffiella horikoshii TaxID=79883 RepID=UPI001CC00A90|nr:polysaccharide biosynthesis protein [Sutcliffiella horikoshii]UAL47502.1 polysaccharide biosynthesis protein [Sutcliffiella horikoshii]
MNDLSSHSYQKVWKGAMILTVAGIIIKILSAAYRVPFQNIVGDVGFYIYQQVYPFYGVAIILSTYGFPVVISKIIAEHPENTREQAARKIRWVSFCFLTLLGLSFFLLLYLGAPHLAAFMGDLELSVLIKIVSFSFLLLPLVSVWRGSFQGLGEMTPTAVSQVSEQVIRVGTILVLSYLLMNAGFSLYEVGAGAIFGSVIGGIAAVLILLAFYQKRKREQKHTVAPSNMLPSSKSIVKVLMLQGFTICISSLLLVLFQMVDAFTIYAGLLDSGVDAQSAKGLKGVYDRGQPLIQLGTVVATAFSLSLVPYIILSKDKEEAVKEKISLSIRVSIGVGAGAAVGLAWLIKPVNVMLFSNENGYHVLLVLGLSILFCSIALTAAAILQGLGNPYLPALFVGIGIGFKYLLNVLLIPVHSTMGAAVSTLVAFSSVAVMMVLALKKKTGTSIFERMPTVPLLVSIGMMSAVLAVYLLLTDALIGDSRTLATFQSIVGVVIGGLTYLLILIKNHFFTKEELMLLPLGKKLVKLLK